MEMENINFKGEKRVRKMEINRLGEIALRTRHLLKERLMIHSAAKLRFSLIVKVSKALIQVRLWKRWVQTLQVGTGAKRRRVLVRPSKSARARNFDGFLALRNVVCPP
jgi:hypothetical protein